MLNLQLIKIFIFVAFVNLCYEIYNIEYSLSSLNSFRDNIGFPIVECDASGDLILSKPPKTGGMVSIATVSEQLVYEIGDPARYLLPDVACDFRNVQMKEVEGMQYPQVKMYLKHDCSFF